MSKMPSLQVKACLNNTLRRQQKAMQKLENKKRMLDSEFLAELGRIRKKCDHARTEEGTLEDNMGDTICSDCGSTVDEKV